MIWYQYVGQYKHRSGTNVCLVQTSDVLVPISDSSNIGLVQTSDQCKRRTSTNVRPKQTSDLGKILLTFRRIFKNPIFSLSKILNLTESEDLSSILALIKKKSNGLIKLYQKELSFCHKRKFSNPYIFSTWWC